MAYSSSRDMSGPSAGAAPSDARRGARRERLKQALFRGENLRLADLQYRHFFWALVTLLLEAEWNPCDLTNVALVRAEQEEAEILANERGVLGGIAETEWLFRQFGLRAEREKDDSDSFEAGETLLRIQGSARSIFSLKRVGLNVLQRMSGIATATRKVHDAVQKRSADTFVVATRKTPWGLLDKRAIECGGGGTHRLGLGDAILIKTDHLMLHADREEEAIPSALRQAWPFRERAGFIEVEVTGKQGAVAAAETFQSLQRADGTSFPCLLLLDNVLPQEVASIVALLRVRGVWDDVLVEASGAITETQIEAYADCGVDALSMGCLTDSCRALDLRLRLESHPKRRQ